MVLGTTQSQAGQPDLIGGGKHFSEITNPAAIRTNWFVVCTAPDVAESDSGVVVGGKVVKPGAIVRPEQHLFQPNEYGTTLLIALKYNTDMTLLTSPIIRAFGRSKLIAADGTATEAWHLLTDSGGVSELTLTVDDTVDTVSVDGTYAITDYVEVDMNGCDQVIVAVQTAFDVSAGTKNDSEILVKAI